MSSSLIITVLGSGVSGLGVALKAKEVGLKCILYEARDSGGGLLDNFFVQEFRFDYSVHLSFAEEKKVREIFDKSKFIKHSSESTCFEQDKWLKHPVQNNLFPLDLKTKVELIESFIKRPKTLDDKSYKSWLIHQYGEKISFRYPLKYTLKYWNTDPEKLSTNWIGNRMRRAELKEILNGAISESTPNHYYAKEMRYPSKGGFKSFIRPLLEIANVRYNHKCTEIDIGKKQLFFKNKKIEHYEKLVSSLPLPELIKLIKKCPLPVREAAKRLCATSIDLVSIGFNKIITPKLWFYIYDEDIFASRAHSPSVKSNDSCPPNTSSLQFETYSRGLKSRYTKKSLIKNCIYALKKMNLADEKDILFVDHRRINYGNVIFDLGMEDNRKIVRDWLHKNDIITCGRFGEWDYLWSNQSLMSGYNAI
tara:strand:+ start:6298 stop:7560 length:1263 start_codon:yes stop_codon:yes gene_type:complete